MYSDSFSPRSCRSTLFQAIGTRSMQNTMCFFRIFARQTPYQIDMLKQVMDTLEQLYLSYTTHKATLVQPIAGAGSPRRYYRLSSPAGTLIGVQGSSADENRAFIALSKHLATKGFYVPQVVAVSDDEMCYLQTDLGDLSLYDRLATCRNTGFYDEASYRLLAETMRQLAAMQIGGDIGLDYNKTCYPVSYFDERAVLFDLNYFKYCFLKASGLEYDENRLQDDFELLAQQLPQAYPAGFMYRDFQSRNVMIKDDKPWFIDFQGGRRGPVHYDVASFLWQARALYPNELRKRLLGEYLTALQNQGIVIDDTVFRRDLSRFVLFRTLQVLGAYGFRGYYERKPLFLQSISQAIESLRQQLQDGAASDYPYLESTLGKLVAMPRFTPATPRTTLRVTVYSFSYRMGIPDDESGNGGGFVFDCRAIHNPGRYPQYTNLTGLDDAVVRFLEDDGEILPFINHACALVDAAVEKYIKRGFTHLQAAFGCTGGRHRSVYSAQALARHLHEKYPDIEVQLIHREQNIATTYQPRTTP